MDDMKDDVKAWAERVTIPTYAVGPPEKNPLFLEKRVYQGSSGVVYPYPVIESVSDEKSDKEWIAVFLENTYLKIMILPELGGRVQMGLDKSNGHYFVYYNRVIKPALVGLTGPWISGGIEFNWPQHHRPTTYSPMDWRIDENPDGSKTIWCSEIEPMFNTKGMHGLTLYPDQAILEISVQLSNRTSEPQSFLWWANPAVHVNEAHQSVFPPDVHAVMDHGKRAVSEFPIATGTYYKVDYAPGTDISRYKNIPVPTSYMAYHSDFDFMGCYDHDRRAGMMHVANHHLVPGKKQWTWGCGEFGKAWDRQLTDDDGPYIELMCGAYTDNQPDFAWLEPGEEKQFTQVFMPYKEIGAAKNASREVVVNVETGAGFAEIGVYVSSPRSVHVQLKSTGAMLYEETARLSPLKTLMRRVNLPEDLAPQTLTLTILDDHGRALLSYTPLSGVREPIPEPATPAPPPEEVPTIEALFLHGVHLEQYRHASYEPEPYYEEALRRDPLDSRCNNALGLLLYRRGRFAEAESYFRTAVKSLTRRNPNPFDGEAFYNLGLALRMQGRYQEAYDAFYKSVWNAAWQAPGYFELGRLDCRSGRLNQALQHLNHALNRNQLHHKARHLKVAILRRLGRQDDALRETDTAMALDRMEYGALWEHRLLAGDDRFRKYSSERAETYSEIALDYAHAGLLAEAINLLQQSPQPETMSHYYLGWCHYLAGDEEAALEAFVRGASKSPDFVFPNRLESVLALEAAMRLNPGDARAPYYLGNFWYGHRRHEEAIVCWERARELDDNFPTVHRNLGLAYYNSRHDRESALSAYRRAFDLDPADGRVLFELDQLHKKLNRKPEWRLAYLQRFPDLVAKRDDLMVETITLLNLLGRHQDAYQQIMARNFHPWEGGEGKLPEQYVFSLVAMAWQEINKGEHSRAVELLLRAREYPPNLGEGKLAGAQENDIRYALGCAYEGLADMTRAHIQWKQAAAGLSEPTSARYYNDQPPDKIFYQGLAREKLGELDEAQGIFQRLLDYGRQHLTEQIQMDYFAVSLPDFLVFDDDLQLRHEIHCHYMMALGYLGLRSRSSAEGELATVLAMDAYHLGATRHLPLAAERE